MWPEQNLDFLGKAIKSVYNRKTEWKLGDRRVLQEFRREMKARIRVPEMKVRVRIWVGVSHIPEYEVDI